MLSQIFLKKWSFSSKVLIALFMCCIFVSIFSSAAISQFLSKRVTKEVQSRDLQMLFSALESGPLAIARLNSSAIAQSELSRLLENPSFKNSFVKSVTINGGEHGRFTYAKWDNGSLLESRCSEKIEKSFSFPDSVHPFEITVNVNNCYVPEEVSVINRFANLTGLSQTLFGLLLLSLAVFPALLSIRRADNFLTGSEDGRYIPLDPIRKLVERAQFTARLEKEAALSSLATQVAHDIRSPLSVLKLIASTLSGESGEKSELLQQTAIRIDQISNELLNRAKAMNQIDVGFHTIQQLAGQVIREKQVLVSCNDKIKIMLDDKTSSKTVLPISGSDFQRILSNLLNNSIDALPNGGFISVEIKDDEKFLKLTVRDNGKGIPEELMPRIGEKYFTNSKSDGNGIGLHNAKNIVEKAGGRFQVISSPNDSTAVSLEFPI